MSRRAWWNYESMRILEQQMGKHIYFFKEADMTTNISEHYLIGRCATCGAIVKYEAVAPGTTELQQAQTLADWQGEGLKPDKVTRSFFRAWYSSKPHNCTGEDAR